MRNLLKKLKCYFFGHELKKRKGWRTNPKWGIVITDKKTKKQRERIMETIRYHECKNCGDIFAP
jgi:hypothetical protein